MITRQTNKVLYTCCWSLGMLKVSLCIDRGAYVPGDRIILNVEISNQTSAHLNYLHAKLKRVSTKNKHDDQNPNLKITLDKQFYSLVVMLNILTSLLESDM